jgi:hypothetical protein
MVDGALGETMTDPFVMGITVSKARRTTIAQRQTRLQRNADEIRALAANDATIFTARRWKGCWLVGDYLARSRAEVIRLAIARGAVLIEERTRLNGQQC